MALAIGIDSATHCLPSGSDFNPLTCRMSRQSEDIGNASLFDSSRKAFCKASSFNCIWRPMLTCTPSKPIFFASAIDSVFAISRRFQSGAPTLNFTPAIEAWAAYARNCRRESAATVAAAPDRRKLRLEIVIEWTPLSIWLRCGFSVDIAAHNVCRTPRNCQYGGQEGSNNSEKDKSGELPISPLARRARFAHG